MKLDFIELFLDQGADFNHIIYLKDDLSNEPINVAGYIVSSQMRRSFYSQNASANIVCTITDATQGEISLSLIAEVTADLVPDRYVFDVLVRDPGGILTRVLEGRITVTPSVTR